MDTPSLRRRDVLQELRGPPEPIGINVPEWSFDTSTEERRAQMNATTYGLDVAKQILQMYWFDALQAARDTSKLASNDDGNVGGAFALNTTTRRGRASPRA